MALHRRRVYSGYSHSYSRRMRMESSLYFSIYVAAGVFFLSLVGCLPEFISLIVSWLRSAQYPQPGFSVTEQGSFLVTLCEILMTVSGAYLVLALLIRSNTR
jgi:hypothetical protein